MENFFWKWFSQWAEKDFIKETILSLQEGGKNAKKIEFTPLPDSNILPFLKGFKKDFQIGQSIETKQQINGNLSAKNKFSTLEPNFTKSEQSRGLY